MPQRRYIVAALLLHIVVGLLSLLSTTLGQKQVQKPQVIEAVMLDPTPAEVEAERGRRNYKGA